MSALILFPLTDAALARLRLRGVLRSREIAGRSEWEDFEDQHREALAAVGDESWIDECRGVTP